MHCIISLHLFLNHYYTCSLVVHVIYSGIQEKIEILKRKCLYDDAIQLAKNNQDDHMNLIKAHGDHLASKGGRFYFFDF